MRVVVNDTEREIPDGITVAELLRMLELHDSPCAVEVNKSLSPKREHAERRLADGDRLEIVTLVGGG